MDIRQELTLAISFALKVQHMYLIAVIDRQSSTVEAHLSRALIISTKLLIVAYSRPMLARKTGVMVCWRVVASIGSINGRQERNTC